MAVISPDIPMAATPALRSATVATLPDSSNVWMCYPHIVTCSGAKLEVHMVDCKGAPLAPQRLHSISLKQYDVKDQLATPGTGGRGSNVIHGSDFHNGWLACGTASGLVLVLDLRNTTRASTSGSLPPTKELAGHSKVVGFLRLSRDATRLFTSSLDKSVRLWSLPDGACLQSVKAGTPVLQLTLLPSSAGSTADEQRVVMGCGDGTVRVWDPNVKKATKALSTLRYTHNEYVGEIRLAVDGSRLLTCARDGGLQLWRRDEKHGFIPEPEAMPPCDVAAYWRVELLPSGLVGISKFGGVQLWPWGSRTHIDVVGECLSSALIETEAAQSYSTLEPPVVVEGAGRAADGDDGEPPLLLVFIGMRQVASGATDVSGSSRQGELELHELRCAVPSSTADAPPPLTSPGSVAAVESGGGRRGAPTMAGTGAGAAPAVGYVGWERWRSVASEEGVEIDAMVQQKLGMMETVAASAGRELGEATVRAFLKKCVVKDLD